MSCSGSSSSSLVPIRVDVFYENNVRIVDTLLLDPNLLLDDNVDRNASTLAYTILGEAEVMGMGRTVRHFTGRLDLYNQKCFQAIVDCIRPQLVSIQTMECRKRKRNDDETRETKKIKRDTTEVKTETTAEIKQEDTNIKDGDAATEKDDTDAIVTKDKKTSDSRLIPIRIRLSVHGVRIHDDFDWDPNLNVSPLEMAHCIGQDLQLSDEAIQAIAISICEQVHGLDVSTGTQIEADEGGPTDRRNTTAAWHLDQRIHITNVAHLVAQHRK